jgi:shikimate kinase
VARELARLLTVEHVDTDALIAERAGTSIAAIFAAEGEAGFRRCEQEVIAQVATRVPAVISLGGGAVLDDRNVKTLQAVATMVWLTAPAKVLWQRTSADEGSREARPPLTERAGLAEVEHLLAQRTPVYERAADFTIDTTGRTPREVAQAITDVLSRGVRK